MEGRQRTRVGLRRAQLGVQAHCLRREMAVDFPGTLGRVNALGIGRIEMCSFPGCRGNPWGDFGELADWSAGRIRDELATAELDCVGTHFAAKELAGDELEAAIRWARDINSPAIVLGGLRQAADADGASWRAAFESLNEIGRRVADHGLDFAYHTQNDVWCTVGGTLLAEELFRIVDPELCHIELDPSGALVFGVDWTASVRQNPGRFFAMHLRDGSRPDHEVRYLPALPLGEGDVDWRQAIDAAVAAEIPLYILEMEVDADRDPFDALLSSLGFLESLHFVDKG
jgi:sugar phosphate isomerase/epimerase